MSTISSPVRLARPSAVVSPTITDVERVALQIPGLSLIADASERASEFSGIALRDRIGARVGQAVGGTSAKINGNPAVSFSGEGAIDVGVHFKYQLPRSYFIATCVRAVDIANTSVMVSDAVNNSTSLAFLIMNTGALRLQHGSANFIAAASAVTTLPRTHVLWASYDHLTGDAEIGIDSATAAARGTIAAEHTGSDGTVVWGGPSTQWGLNGMGGICAIGDRPFIGDAHQPHRASILAWLAEYGNVTIAP